MIQFDPAIDSPDRHPLVVEHDTLLRDLNARLETTLAGIATAAAMLRAAEDAAENETPAQHAARLIAGTDGASVAREQQTLDRLRARADEIRATAASLRDARAVALQRARTEMRAAVAPARARLLEAAWKAATTLEKALSAVDEHDIYLMVRESAGCPVDADEHRRRYGARLANTLPSAATIREAIAAKG